MGRLSPWWFRNMHSFSRRCAVYQVAGGALLAVVICISFASCGARGPDIVPVSGTVTRNGKPVPNVTIYFHPTSGRPSLGEVDSQGKFKLRYTHDQDGAKVGNHTIQIVYFPDPSKGAAPADFKEIVSKYGEPEKSPLKVELKKAERNLEIKLD